MSELLQVAPDVWVVERPLRMAGTQIGCRMTVVRLPAGELLLHSPVPPDDAWIRALQPLGPVAWIVAPSLLHNLFTPAAKEAYPEATVLAPPGFESIHPALATEALLEAEALRGSFDWVCVGGMPKVNEVAMFHRASRTLLVADLVFNLPAEVRGFTRFFFKYVNGGIGKPVQTRIFRTYIKDADAYHESMKRIVTWDVDRIILSHGDIVNADGKETLQDVYRTR